MSIEYMAFDDWHVWLAELRIDALRNLGTVVEQSIASELHAFEDKVGKTSAMLPDAQRQEFYEWHESEHHRYATELPGLGREFIVVKGFIILDDELAQIAKWLGRRCGKPFQASKMPGQNRRTLEYLRSCGFNLTPTQRTDLEALRHVRNAIVHQDGVLTSEQQDALTESFLSASIEVRAGRVHFAQPIHQDVFAMVAGILGHLATQIRPATT